MRGVRRIMTTAGLLFLVAATAVAVRAAETTGLTGSTIKIGVLAPITGVQAHFGASIKTVTELMAKEVNEAGGIHGRKLELIVEDEACSGTKARAAVNKLIFRDQVFAIFGGTCAAAIVPTIPVMVDNQTPYMTPMVIAEKLTDPFSKYIFRAQVPATIIGRLMVAYGTDRFGAKRVAIVSQDDEYGAGELKGSLLELKRKNIDLVAHETHKVGDADFSAQALRLKQANPDLVLIHSYAPQTAALVKKAFELGVRAQYVGGVASGITRITELIGEEPSRGMYSAISVVVDPTGKSHPLTKDFVARYTKEYPEHSKRPGIPGPGEFQVLSGAAVFIEGLKRAGRELNREKFIQALETIRGMETGGYRAVSFSKDNHDGVLSAHFWHYEKDGVVRVTDKIYSVD
jgi:branched-chain amino acid transport system substrate-binding protein